MTFLPETNSLVSVSNSGTATSSVITGTYENVSMYSLATITAIGTVTLTLYDSTDTVNSTTTSVTITTSGSYVHPITTKWFKLITNSFTGSLQTVYTKESVGEITMATTYKGRYEESPVNYVGSTMSTQHSITSPLDAFGRVQVSRPFTLFSSKQQTSGVSNVGHPFDYDIYTNGTGASTTYLSGLPQTKLSVTTSANTQKVIVQQHCYSTYQPGKSLRALITGTLLTNTSVSNVTARIGYFDDINDKVTDGVKTGDGFFFEHRGSGGIYVVYRTSNASSPPPAQNDYAIAQASWNIDPLDGTGPSGYTADWSQRQIFVINMEWLGVGNVLMGIVINFKFLWCHQWQFSGGQYGTNKTLAYNCRASLPTRYELSTTAAGASANVSMIQVCSSVSSEGGFQPYGPIYSTIDTFTGAPARASNDTEYPVMALRLMTTSANAYKNRPRTTLNLLAYSLLCFGGTANVIARIYKFISPATPPSFSTPGTWVNSDSLAFMYGSAAEYNADMNGTITWGSGPYHLVTECIVSTNALAGGEDLTDKITLQSNIQGVSDWLLITALHSATGGGGTSRNYLASLQWQEYA